MHYFLGFFFFISVLAHEFGHGPKHIEKGPHGGTLVSFVLAKDADLGEKAPQVALMEVIDFKTYKEIYFLQSDMQDILKLPNELKVIRVFHSKDKKPDVKMHKREHHPFQIPILGDEKLIEVIGEFEGIGKIVAAIVLNDKK